MDGCAECVSVGLFSDTLSGCHTPPRLHSKSSWRGRTDAFLLLRMCAPCTYTYIECRKGSLRGNHYGVKALREKHRQEENIRRGGGETRVNGGFCCVSRRLPLLLLFLVAIASLLRFHFAPLAMASPFC